MMTFQIHFFRSIFNHVGTFCCWGKQSKLTCHERRDMYHLNFLLIPEDLVRPKLSWRYYHTLHPTSILSVRLFYSLPCLHMFQILQYGTTPMSYLFALKPSKITFEVFQENVSPKHAANRKQNRASVILVNLLFINSITVAEADVRSWLSFSYSHSHYNVEMSYRNKFCRARLNSNWMVKNTSFHTPPWSMHKSCQPIPTIFFTEACSPRVRCIPCRYVIYWFWYFVPWNI